MERDLAKPADQVFATAVGLAETLEKINPTTKMIPNGAAYEIFSRVQTEKDTLPCPEDMKGWGTRSTALSACCRSASTMH